MILKLSLFAALAIIHVASASYHARTITKVYAKDAYPIKLSHGACAKGKNGKSTSEGVMATVKRGATISVNGYKNSRLGGIVRFALVPLRSMYDREAHDNCAFYYTCADIHPLKCTIPMKEFCNKDHRYEHYSYFVKIPATFGDGIYVIGVARYGSFPNKRVNSKFIRGIGDYYSCIRIRIKGGPKHKKHKIRFVSGPSLTGAPGYCRTTNKDLHCLKRHCYSNSPRLQMPMEFMKGQIRPKHLIARLW